MKNIKDGFTDSVGNTPLIRLRHLSEETGCEILGKAEFMNPGGSVKDRAAKWIVLDAERRRTLKPGVTVVSDEETVPNNGYDKEYVIPAKSRLDGTITADDMHEVAIKLASVENYLNSPKSKMSDASITDTDAPSAAEACNNIFDLNFRRSNS